MSHFIHALPKIELHVHLEGAIGPEALLEIFRRHGNSEYATPEAVARLYRHRDFPEFLEHMRAILRWLRAEEDFEPITYAFLTGLAAQNVRYVETILSPGALAFFNGLDCDRILDAVLRGYERARSERPIEMALVIDLVRNMGVENGWKVARWAAGAKDRGVVGITLGGNEREFPAAPFADIYRWAREQGLRTTAHAGEGDGPASIWDCLRLLQVERIGHGVRMVEDPALVEHIVEHRVPIECCPGSNVATAVVPSLAAHPVRRLFEQGVPLSISTDDPALFRTSLTRELEDLQETHAFTDAEIAALMRQAVAISFLPEQRKEGLIAEIRAAG